MVMNEDVSDNQTANMSLLDDILNSLDKEASVFLSVDESSDSQSNTSHSTG